MTQSTRAVRVVVELALTQAVVFARAAVVVTSALDCKDVNAAEQGLLAFRTAVDVALRKRPAQAVVDQPEVAVEQSRRASRPRRGSATVLEPKAGRTAQVLC